MMTLAHSTQIAIQIVVDDDTGNVAALIMALTVLITLLVGLGGFVAGVVSWLNRLWLDTCELAGILSESARLTNALFMIGFKSLLFGLGVST